MSNAAYWQKRAAGRMFEYQAEADAVADELSKEYIRASNYITGEAEKVLRSFQGISGISVEEAELLLSDLPDKVTLDNLKAVVDNIPDSKTRHDMLNIINSPAYSYRIRRFEELQREIDVQTQKLAKSEISVTGAHYKALCEEAYLKNIFEVQKGTGIGFSFSKLPKSRIDEIMKQNWSGKLFSERIWGREGIVNDTLKKELLVGIMSGRSNVKTATAIEEALGASAIDARRLVRTESTYIANAAEMESYKELDIEKYEFMATLDMRTSDVCSALDGKTFPVKDGVPGVNMPPMHPWCRSTTIAVIDGAVTDSLKRRARDPETNELYEVPKDMTYEQWKAELDNKHGEGYTDTRRKMVRNEKSDRKQYEKYISVLGKENMPKTFDLFQDLKYNNSEGWAKKKRECNTIREIKGKDWSDSFKQSAIDAYYEFLKKGIEMSCHALSRYIPRSKKGHFSFNDIIECNKQPYNFVENDGKTTKYIKYYNGIAVIYNNARIEVVSVVKRKTAKKEWLIYEDKENS